MFRNLIILSIVFFSVSGSAQTSSFPWEFVEKKGEVVLLKQEVFGEEIKNYRGTTKIRAPLAQVAHVLNDPASYHRFIPRTRQSFIQERQKDGFLFYLRIKGPFLIWDRETYLFTNVRCENRNENSDSQKQISISFTTEHPHVKQIELSQEKVIRLPKMEGHWHLWKAENPQETYVEYEAFIDGGGRLTNYLKNKAVQLWIARTLTNLQKRMVQVGPADLSRLQNDAPALFPDCLSPQLP